MKNKILVSIILIVILFSLTGCYDASSIENSYYIVALGLDLEDENTYKISVQIAKNQSSSSGDSDSSQSSSYTIYSVTAQTIDSGITILDNFLNKQINLSHCSALVISETLARQGIGTLINSLANSNELRPNCYVLISSTTATDVLDKVSNSGEDFSARFYEYIINSVNYTGYSINTNFGDFVSDMNDSSGEAIAIYSYVSDDTVQNSGLAIFKDDKMVGSTSALYAVAHLLLTDELEETLITIPSPFDDTEYIDLNIGMQKNTDKAVEIINNTPYITCKIYVSATIKTSGENYDYTNTDNIKLVEDSTSKYLEEIVLGYLYTLAKEYNSDVLNFQNELSKSCLTNDELESYHWTDVYTDSFFNVTVETSINSTHLFDKE